MESSERKNSTDVKKPIIHQVIDSSSKLNLEALLDAITALYHDINLPALRKGNPKVQKFLRAYEPSINAACIERVKLSDFTEHKLLGQGAFGEVKLVRHNKTKKVYAIKTLNKRFMVRKWLQDASANFFEER